MTPGTLGVAEAAIALSTEITALADRTHLRPPTAAIAAGSAGEPFTAAPARASAESATRAARETETALRGLTAALSA
jgi:hypothetical protein